MLLMSVYSSGSTRVLDLPLHMMQLKVCSTTCSLSSIATQATVHLLSLMKKVFYHKSSINCKSLTPSSATRVCHE
ncbi:hypothetical protein SLEP1_g17521 [Rubroshorea leprosula]|uniref:Uncharacterized protein n=1 Tax=Rubroshorea leprosula TaxID=152421 RepID=A0AAV5J3F9_9ROSI|nr:hypothetical protein SLEP1_g17521 [Rubroshorea leprosula]